MASDFRNKYRLRLDDGSSRDMWYAGDISIFKQFIDYKARRNRWLEGIAPKTESTANWTNPFSRTGRDAFFQAQRVRDVRQVDSVRGVIDRRDGEFYRTVRIGKFLYEGKICELEWMAEDLRYEGKNKRKPLGIPAPNGGGRLYTIDELSRWTSENDPDSLRVGFGNMPLIPDSVASDEAIAKASGDLARDRSLAEFALLNIGSIGRIIAMHAAIVSPDEVNTADVQSVGDSLLVSTRLDTQIAVENAIGSLTQTQSDMRKILPANAGANELLLRELGVSLNPIEIYSNLLYRAFSALNAVMDNVEPDDPAHIEVPARLGERIQYLGQTTNGSFGSAYKLASVIVRDADMLDEDWARYAAALTDAVHALVAGLYITGGTIAAQLNDMKDRADAAHGRVRANQLSMHDSAMQPIKVAVDGLAGLGNLSAAISVLNTARQTLYSPGWNEVIGIRTARQVVEAERLRLSAFTGQSSAAILIEIQRTRNTLDASYNELNIARGNLRVADVSLEQLAYDLGCLASIIPPSDLPPPAGTNLVDAVKELNGDIELLNIGIEKFIYVLGEKIKGVDDPEEIIEDLKNALRSLSSALRTVNVDTTSLLDATEELVNDRHLNERLDKVAAAVRETKVPDVGQLAPNDLYYILNISRNNLLQPLIARLLEVRLGYESLASLKTKRYYAPEQGWRIPRNSDITWLQVFTRGLIISGVTVIKPPTLMPYTDYTQFKKVGYADNPELAKLLSADWPFIDGMKIQLWGNRARLGFDATVHASVGAGRRYDAYTLLEINQAESGGIECSFGSFWAQTRPGDKSVMLTSGTLVGADRRALRLVRTVPIGS